MKKAYSKPDILFDSFSVSVNIAACAVPTNFSKEDQCGYQYVPGMNLFFEGYSGCNVIAEDNSPVYDSICYHNFSDYNRLFNS